LSHHSPSGLLILSPRRWLIDHDKDDEGKAVIVDLHGGNEDHPTAAEEFAEIKATVMAEVTGASCLFVRTMVLTKL
jgi:hypothetical protein